MKKIRKFLFGLREPVLLIFLLFLSGSHISDVLSEKIPCRNEKLRIVD